MGISGLGRKEKERGEREIKCDCNHILQKTGSFELNMLFMMLHGFVVDRQLVSHRLVLRMKKMLLLFFMLPTSMHASVSTK